MPDIRLTPLAPLGGHSPRADDVGPVRIAETDDRALASVAERRGREKDLAGAARKAGIPLPPAGRAEAGVVYGAFWMGPGLWMVDASLDGHEDIAAGLLPVFGDAASITEQTGAWARFEVTGDDLPRLFERLCTVDLARAEPGAAIRTTIEHLGAFLLVRDARRVDVISARSSAGSLHHALVAAARSVF